MKSLTPNLDAHLKANPTDRLEVLSIHDGAYIGKSLARVVDVGGVNVCWHYNETHGAALACIEHHYSKTYGL